MITRQQAVRYAAVLLALLASGRAQGQGGGSYTEIQGTGQSLYRIAVPPVLDDGGAALPAQVATQVMTRDLRLYGLFKVLDPKGFLADLAKEGTGIDASAWANAGAQAVIKARASARGIEFFLYEVGKGARPVLQRHYLGDGKQARRMAHQFGDEVVKHLTGERGIFTTKLAFAAGNRRAGVSHIYVMDYDGHGVARVSRTGQQNVSPALGPGGLLAYTSFLWKNPDLFVMPLGGRANRISRQPGLNTAAAWAPGGGRLAVTLSKDGNSEIYVISATGQVLKRLTHNAAIDTSPTWSPDGSQLAFVSNRGGSPQIYVMSASGGGARRLTFRGSYNQEPDWCPRADTPVVAFTGRDERGHYDIFTVNVQSGEVKRLTQGQGSNQGPTWAPNGRLIAFSSSRGGVWVATPDGLNQQQVYRGQAETLSWGK